MTDLIIDEKTRLARARQSEDLARWLREAGHRTKPPRRLSTAELTDARATRLQGGLKSPLKGDPVRLVRLSIIGLLAASYLQYFYFDAMLQVYSMHSLIVFVLMNRHA
jgi:hypothetical protein